MMRNKIPIIVLTPVKNEEWVLEKFLQVTSLFADTIIIADQGSTDRTKEIALQYPKVDYIINDCATYNENYRQNLLIERARELYSGPKLLLALDSDEFITANSINSAEWEHITGLLPGTRVFFKKPDILPGTKEYIPYDDSFYLGFIDDGSPHNGKVIHSPRLPIPEKDTKRFVSDNIIFMHLSLVRDLEYKARQRLYSIMEKQEKNSSWQIRLRMYSPTLQRMGYTKKLKPVPAEWIAVFEQKGVDVVNFQTSELNQYNRQILEHFYKYGVSKYWWEDIWAVDYSEIKKKFKESGDFELPDFSIRPAPMWITAVRNIAIMGLLYYSKWKNKSKN